MDRAVQIAQLWNWLPAFRAVAETQHLPTAAAAMHVGASALSRSIKLLEDRLSEPLFERVGRELRLNAAGESLLRATRDAMRIVDDGCALAKGRTMAGPFHISAAGGLISGCVLPSLKVLRCTFPELQLYLHNDDTAHAHTRLLRGELDIAIQDRPSAHPMLFVETLETTSNGIYCGRPHPLFDSAAPDLSEATAHTFAAPVPGPDGVSGDGWPMAIKRDVSVYTAQMSVGLELCLGGDHLAVLPEVVGNTWVARDLLRRLPLSLIPDTPLFAVRRRSAEGRSRVERVLELIRQGMRIFSPPTQPTTPRRKRV